MLATLILNTFLTNARWLQEAVVPTVDIPPTLSSDEPAVPRIDETLPRNSLPQHSVSTHSSSDPRSLYPYAYYSSPYGPVIPQVPPSLPVHSNRFPTSRGNMVTHSMMPYYPYGGRQMYPFFMPYQPTQPVDYPYGVALRSSQAYPMPAGPPMSTVPLNYAANNTRGYHQHTPYSGGVAAYPNYQAPWSSVSMHPQPQYQQTIPVPTATPASLPGGDAVIGGLAAGPGTSAVFLPPHPVPMNQTSSSASHNFVYSSTSSSHIDPVTGELVQHPSEVIQYGQMTVLDPSGKVTVHEY